MWWGGGVRIVKVLKWCATEGLELSCRTSNSLLRDSFVAEKVLYSVSFRAKFVSLAGSRKGDRHVIWNWNPPSRLDVHDLLLHWYLHICFFPPGVSIWIFLFPCGVYGVIFSWWRKTAHQDGMILCCGLVWTQKWHTEVERSEPKKSTALSCLFSR